MDHVCFMYHHRQWLTESIVQAAVHPDAIPRAFQKIFSTAASPVMTGSRQTTPNVILDTPEKFEWTIQDYQARYSWISTCQMAAQFRFLRAITTTCRESGIKLVVVNMPLTAENRQLLPLGLYKAFKDTVIATVGENGTVMDFEGRTQCPRQFFSDSVHLNEHGCAQLNQVLAQELVPVLR